MHDFYDNALQITSMQDIHNFPYTTIAILAMVSNINEPTIIIPDGNVSLICGPSPYIQVMDGVYPVSDSTIFPSVSNNSNLPLTITKGQVIKGSVCHQSKNIYNKISNSGEGWTKFHSQAKSYIRLTQIDELGTKLMNINNPDLLTKGINPWVIGSLPPFHTDQKSPVEYGQTT